MTIYEARAADDEPRFSGVTLSPNGLAVLDRIGVLERIRKHCYIPTNNHPNFSRDPGEPKTFADFETVYRYRNHRVWRRVLLFEMRRMLQERSVSLKYSSRFGGIVSDDEDNVSFLVNEEVHHASILLGSDGLYSTVRKHLAPSIVPEYTGLIGIMSHVKRDAVNWPSSEYEPYGTLQGVPGAFFFIPEDSAQQEIMVGMQFGHPEQTREDLDKLQADKDRLIEYFGTGYGEWDAMGKSIIDAVSANKDSCYIWPYMRIPSTWQWFSETGRVIVIGDGAHALPPSSAQGINQALEDAYTLALLLTSSSHARRAAEQPSPLAHALASWQKLRQQKVNAIFDWTRRTTDVHRLPEEERRRLAEQSDTKVDGEDTKGLSWLYRLLDDDAIQADIYGS